MAACAMSTNLSLIDRAVQIAAMLWQHDLPPVVAEGPKHEMHKRLTELRAKRAETRETRMEKKKKAREAREKAKLSEEKS